MNKLTPFFLLGLILCTAAAPAPATRQAGDDDAGWSQAHAKFVRYITPIIEDARTRLEDPHIAWARVTGDLLRKYLPDQRLYVRDGAYDGQSMIWIVTKDGRITDLGDGVWTSMGASNIYTVEKVSGFLKDRKIKIDKPEQAVEVAKLFETIQSAPSFVGMLRLNTKDYTLFDENFLNWMYGSQANWKYTASKEDAGWQVIKEYIGPPAAVQQPPTYDLKVDGDNRFADLRRR